MYPIHALLKTNVHQLIGKICPNLNPSCSSDYSTSSLPVMILSIFNYKTILSSENIFKNTVQICITFLFPPQPQTSEKLLFETAGTSWTKYYEASEDEVIIREQDNIGSTYFSTKEYLDGYLIILPHCSSVWPWHFVHKTPVLKSLEIVGRKGEMGKHPLS